MNRFYLYVAMAFVTSFVGVSWAARGFPVNFWSVSFVQPLPALADSTFGDEHAKQYERKMWEAQHTAQSDGNPALDKLRLDALQAANAYAMSPCDSTMKQNVIEALTAYTRAWQKKIDCRRPQNMLMFCGDAKIKAASDTFSTALDLRVHAAFEEAFQQHGIVQADFPEDVRFDMLQFSGSGLWINEQSPVCLPRERASANGSR
ncbi:MAG: hypothetical protein KGK16_06935 [Bradyrhizobium sp.]|nr:hypothetical protein [Bradyrhizobium sp.]